MTTIADICTMYLLLTAATPAEIQPTIDFLEKHDFAINSHAVEILLTGVSAVSTTYLLTHNINNRRPDIMIQAGIAGSFKSAKTGEVITVLEDVFGDLGAWENDQFKNIFELGLADKKQASFNNQFLKNPNHKLISLSGLEQVRAISVNEISTDNKRIEWYKQNLSPAVESMEGAAFHYVCLRENIPFLQIRAVSNLIGERDKTKWNIKEAVINLNDNLILLLKQISQYDETYFRI